MEIISESLFKEKVRGENTGKVVVQMSTSWCGPCKKMKVMMDSLSSTYDDINLCYMDIGECTPEFSNVFNIRSVPTTVFFENIIILFNLHDTLACIVPLDGSAAEHLCR